MLCQSSRAHVDKEDAGLRSCRLSIPALGLYPRRASATRANTDGITRPQNGSYCMEPSRFVILESC
jgi:hypothetical protein